MTLTETGERTALYRFFDGEDVLLYVGITDKPGRRWEQHMRSQPWWPDARRQTVQLLDTRELAEAAEKTAVREERPVYNLAHAAFRASDLVTDGEPWRCGFCGWEAFAPDSQIAHMRYEMGRLEKADRVADRAAAQRLEAELGRAQQAMERLAKSMATSQALFARVADSAPRRGRPSGQAEPLPSETEARMLLDDLRHVAGTERVRIAELPPRLRSRRPDSALYRKMNGVQLRAILRARGVRTTSRGNVPVLNPADLPRGGEV